MALHIYNCLLIHSFKWLKTTYFVKSLRQIRHINILLIAQFAPIFHLQIQWMFHLPDKYSNISHWWRWQTVSGWNFRWQIVPWVNHPINVVLTSLHSKYTANNTTCADNDSDSERMVKCGYYHYHHHLSGHYWVTVYNIQLSVIMAPVLTEMYIKYHHRNTASNNKFCGSSEAKHLQFLVGKMAIVTHYNTTTKTDNVRLDEFNSQQLEFEFKGTNWLL